MFNFSCCNSRASPQAFISKMRSDSWLDILHYSVHIGADSYRNCQVLKYFLSSDNYLSSYMVTQYYKEMYVGCTLRTPGVHHIPRNDLSNDIVTCTHYLMQFEYDSTLIKRNGEELVKTKPYLLTNYTIFFWVVSSWLSAAFVVIQPFVEALQDGFWHFVKSFSLLGTFQFGQYKNLTWC